MVRGRTLATLPRVKTTTAKWRRSDWAFNGALSEPVHRWYRLTASFSPAFVRRVLAGRVSVRVLDPFAGVGTTLVESGKLGHKAFGVELNPFLFDVAALKATVRRDDIPDLQKHATAAATAYRRAERETRGVRMASWRKGALHPPIPNLHAIEKWWAWPLLRRLLLLRQAIDEATPVSSRARMFLRIALADVAMALDQQSHTSLSYPGLGSRFEPGGPFDATVSEMIEDLGQHNLTGDARCIQGDSRSLDRLLLGQEFDLVVTSPPYCNRFTYTRQTRPMLYFLGYFNETRQSGDLDVRAIGGTWGRATDRLRRVIVEPAPEIRPALRRIRKLEQISRFAHNYAVEYFNSLYAHLHSLQGHLNQQGELHYVVGTSYLHGVEVPADRMLGDIMQAAGYDVTSIDRVRRRHSKKDLYEAHVMAKVSK